MKKITAIMTVLSISAALFASCGKGGESDSLSAAGVLPLNAFDEYDDVASVFYKNMLGSVDVNKDAKYITEGEGSAKIEIDNDQTATGNYEKYVGTPYLSFSTKGEYGTQLRDLSGISALGIDLYNANDYDVNVILKVNSEDKEILNDWAVVRGGETGNLRFAVNPFFLEEVNGDILEYNFYLDYPAETGKTVFYVDNFHAVLAEEEAALEVKTPAAGTILDFSTDSDLLYIRNIAGEPKTSWVLRYNLPNFWFARSAEVYADESKKSSLKLVCKGATLDSDSQPNIYFEEHQRYGIQVLTRLVQKCVGANTSAVRARVMADSDAKVYLRVYDSVTGVYAEKAASLPAGEWTDVVLDDFTGIDISRPGKITLLYDSWNMDAFNLYIDGIYTEVTA